MPNDPKTPRNPNIDTTKTAPDKENDEGGRTPQRRDRGPGVEQEHERERELEDHVGRDTDAEPEMVPPGTLPMRRGGDSDIEGDRGPGLDDEAMIAERANQRTSDRVDARDGVDNSDMIGNDPDAAGKPRRRGR